MTTRAIALAGGIALALAGGGTARGQRKVARQSVVPAPALQVRAPARKAPPARARLPRPIRVLSTKQAVRFMDEVARRESRFHEPGVGYDRETGLTHDGHNIDFETGELAGGPRNWSAASKESLHVTLLVKALESDRTAQLVVSPDDPARAGEVALAILTRKIASFEKFNKRYPGYGGFLPWFKVEDRQMKPMPGWENRVPGLDNGQLAWSLYVAADALQKLGHADVARRVQGHLDLMKKNVVPIFYDPEKQQLRAEAELVEGSGVAPEKNRYLNHVAGYFLDDAYEGLLINHFADLFGSWDKHPDGKEALWAAPRRRPSTYTTESGKKITVVQGHWFSSHEEWGFLVLPFRDHVPAKILYQNAQRVRTTHAAELRIPGLYASTHQPVTTTSAPAYVSDLGIAAIARLPVTPAAILTPYAAFPLALADRRVFATWLKTMLAAPRMWGPRGMGESFSAGGDRMAPVLTWDGKMLPLIAWMGGSEADVRRLLQRDGLYERFLGRVKADYREFEGKVIEGADLPLLAPTATVPRVLGGFRRSESP